MRDVKGEAQRCGQAVMKRGLMLYGCRSPVLVSRAASQVMDAESNWPCA